MFSWQKTPRPILALAPMAGYTDSAFRQLVKSLAPQTIVFSEFVSSDALHFKSKKTWQMLAFSSKEQPFITQIFGKKPLHFAEAAKVVESLGAAGVDLNMGCPARKVVNSDHGSALLKNPKLAAEIIEATVKAVKIPVSVKMRLGVNDSKNLLDFTKMVEASGAKLLTIHGRTAKQMYLGEANYEPIYRVKKILKIPVLGNGDIDSAEKFHAKLGNLDGLMIGRAAVANPWLFREIENSLAGKISHTPKTLKAKLPTILKHAKLMVKMKGEKRGMLEMRKFLAN
ncbi:tRNA dihydrouridine synthase DusB, partial [Candidatus Gracilibacteria bacterium]|nr:tRNA dihydrouridine synthase DusB [Candidatus Gracilibacteria bacterium]